MATTPGILTDWPWKPLGSFKYVILAPWVGQSIYNYLKSEENDRDLTNFVLPFFLLWRVIHNQIWISISRHRTAKGKRRIVDKTIEFDQIDREKDWDDHIIFSGLFFYLLNKKVEGASQLPIWRTDGIIMLILLHMGAVEFVYYWFHRALHHHFLYSRYHSRHHSSVATEPITSVIHPFAEVMAYYILFGTPMVITILTRTSSLSLLSGYVTYIDLMNNMGHCNFELIPQKWFSIFPPLKYLIYTPSYHSLHHTQFRTNYSLFMPFYDYIYDTMDKSSDTLYQTSLQRDEETADVVHLSHLTTPESIYHLRVGLASQASKPETSNWYFWLLWPLTLCSMVITRIFGKTFVVERNIFKNLKLQTWVLPKYKIQYAMRQQREAINTMIEEAILEAEERGVKVLTLGLLNQGEKLNMNGEIFVTRHPKLKVKVVDGSSLAVAIVLNTLPKWTTKVVLRGNINKIACSIALALCQKGIQVTVPCEDDFIKLNANVNKCEFVNNLVLSKTCERTTIWLVGEGLTDEDQKMASKGTIFIPYTQFPPKKLRKDCFYHTPPAMLASKDLQNIDSCQNWLPRRVISAWRIAGILHALEGWDVNECGNNMFDIDRVWEAALLHGFHPLEIILKS